MRVTAARAEDDGLLARLVHRTVAHQPDVCGKERLGWLPAIAGEVRRSGFLLAFEGELDVRLEREARRRGSHRLPSSVR